MCSYYSSISSILSETKSISTFLKDANKYYAHTNRQAGLEPEKLAEHIELVQQYFETSCNLNGLDRVVDSLITDFLESNTIADETGSIGKFVKKLFVNVIVYHDFGKINENFQADRKKMDNPNFKLISNYPLDTRHSELGAYLYFTTHLQEMYRRLPASCRETISCLILLLSYCIFKHHNKRLSDNLRDTLIFDRNAIGVMRNYLSNYGFELDDRFSVDVPKQTGQLLKWLSRSKADFSVYALLKLNFSLLTASDYLATNEYMNGIRLQDEKDFGLITEDLRRRLILNIQVLQAYNKEIYEKYSNSYLFEDPVTKSNYNLNLLRQEMAIKVIRNVRENADKRLFYIEAPTGGGKTNLSTIAAIELLQSNAELNKVFYVFPFTTLITQTYRSIIETLGLSSDEITELHSKAGIQTKEDTEDGQYGGYKKNFIDNLFVNYPFCLLSHVKFFDILKTNEKESNYLLHRLANSVVVVDELQSYNPKLWDKLIYFIGRYSSFFNIRFILMSATLPKLDKLRVLKYEHSEFVYLLGDDAKDRYFLNPNFKDRVSFNFQLLTDSIFIEKTGAEKLDYLADFVIARSSEYAITENGENKPKGSVFSVIEFIFKKTASRFYGVIQSKRQSEFCFDEIFVLSGTILEHRRKEIINFLKSKSNRTKRVLLITTQVVEAGVDIDMDLGFKDVSLVDSDEQLAGRINRNVNKPRCELYIFKLDEAKRIYRHDMRFDFTRNELKNDLYKEVLETKNFDKLYNEILAIINRHNCDEMRRNLQTYRSDINMLNFQTVSDEFNLIDQETLSIFVPMNIPIEVDGTKRDIKDQIFSSYELAFLLSNGIASDNERINGERVFDFYLRIINNRERDFIKSKTEVKILQGIMSKFVFSIFKGKNAENKFIEFSDIEKNKFGFIYLSRWNEGDDSPLYNPYFGINEMAFKDSIFI